MSAPPVPRRTGSPPSSADAFLVRICKALDEPPRMLALNIGVPYADLEPLLGVRHMLAEIDRDEVWLKIERHVERRIGDLLAVRKELDRALAFDRTKRAARIASFSARERKGSPRATALLNKNV